jgi:galactokinase
VNLIGEHTDYNRGLVMPCAIDRETVVAGARREDGVVRVLSLDLDAEATLSLGRLERASDWTDYVAAPVWSLQQAGQVVSGADLVIASSLPRASGLSSSAALGVAVMHMLAELSGLHLNDREIADLVWRGECEFVGVGCGILDQYASALGRAGHALRIDCADRSVTEVPLSAEAVFLIAHSGVPRRLAEGRYLERVEECEAALLQAKRAGVADEGARSLRALDAGALSALEAALESLPFRRARHVLTENDRVEEFAAAFSRGALGDAGDVLRRGMQSLRDDYEVSVPELDALCEIADAHPACHGSRLTGAGWGGCTIHLVDADAAADVSVAIEAGFEGRFARSAEVTEVRASAGASRLSV